MIKLTALDGKKLYINPDHVAAVRAVVHGEGDGKAAVEFVSGRAFIVRETVDEVYTKIDPPQRFY